MHSNIDVFFHRDIDGLFSAICYSAGKFENGTDDHYFFKSIDYGEEINNFSETGNSRAEFLDFTPDLEYLENFKKIHRKVRICDHHKNAFEGAKEHFSLKRISNFPVYSNESNDLNYIFSTEACCIFILKSCEKDLDNFILNDSFREVIRLMGRRDMGEAWAASTNSIDRFMMKQIHHALMGDEKVQAALKSEFLTKKDMYNLISYLNHLDWEYFLIDNLSSFTKATVREKDSAETAIPLTLKGIDCMYVELPEKIDVSNTGFLVSKKFMKPCVCKVKEGVYSVRSCVGLDMERALTVAEAFGGGGHENAAGFRFEGELV